MAALTPEVMLPVAVECDAEKILRASLDILFRKYSHTRASIYLVVQPVTVSVLSDIFQLRN
jgi:hypothetical protein